MNAVTYMAAATGLTALGAVARRTTPAPRVFIGGAVAAIGITLLAQSSPDLATRLAAVILLTAALTSGYDVAQGIVKALN